MLLRSIAWISVLFWVNYAQDDYDDDEIIVSENSTDVPEDMTCPQGWVRLPHTQACYYVSKLHETKTWVKAQSECSKNHAKLLAINSLTERNFILSIINVNAVQYWIGLTEFLNPMTSGRLWSWVDGSLYNSSQSYIINWIPGEPNNFRNTVEECAVVTKLNDSYVALNDEICKNQFPYICEKSDPNELERAVWGCNSHCCYAALRSATYTFAEGNIECIRQHPQAHLPVFKDSAQWLAFSAFKQEAVSDSVTWLGYQDLGTEGIWRTYDDKPPPFIKIAQPNTWRAGQDCATTGPSEHDDWSDSACSQKYRTICQMCTDGEFNQTSSENCPEGWKYFHPTSSCYYFSKTGYQLWSQAQWFCTQSNGDLLTIKSESERDFITSNFERNSNIWIGLTKGSFSNGERGWVWVDGSAFNTDLLSWAPNEQANVNNEGCGSLWKLTGVDLLMVQPVPCDNPWRPKFVCKKDLKKSNTDPVPVNCPEKWMNRMGTPYCYYYSDHLASWEEAEEKCESQQAYLLSVHSREEISFLANRAASSNRELTSYWIGLKSLQRYSQLQWKWVDGLPLNKSELRNLTWLPENQFNSFSESCTAVKDFQTLRKISCRLNYGFPFICVQRGLVFGDKVVCRTKWLTNANLNLCYYINLQTNLTWTAAQKYCASMGGNLLTLHSIKEKDFLRTITKSSQDFFMLGLFSPKNLDNAYLWRWSDGLMFTESDADIINWQPGEPSMEYTGNACVAVGVVGIPAMSSVNCNTKLPFFCKFNAEKPTCDGNTVWSECQGSSECQKTCTNPSRTKSWNCMKVCVSGCICKEGFVRASKSRDYCVPTEDCDAELRKSIAKSNVKNRAEMAKAVCTKDATYLIINTFDCFKAFPTPVPFATAEGTCQRFGGILAIVTDTHTIKELSGLLTSLHLPYVFVGLRRSVLDDWHWITVFGSKLPTALFDTRTPWINGSPSTDQYSKKNAAVLRMCQSNADGCEPGLMDASQDEEFPFVCQFDLRPSVLDLYVASNKSQGSSSSAVAALAILFVCTLLSSVVLLWLHLRKQEKFRLMEEALIARLPPILRRGSAFRSFHVDYANLMNNRGGD